VFLLVVQLYVAKWGGSAIDTAIFDSESGVKGVAQASAFHPKPVIWLELIKAVIK
jgi:hypothetical protein